ncbi:hypothetical protein HN011_005509 [Eciton burchellii]|nr:hypothetical protein HN011_005509 [Eciton burchellii]
MSTSPDPISEEQRQSDDQNRKSIGRAQVSHAMLAASKGKKYSKYSMENIVNDGLPIYLREVNAKYDIAQADKAINILASRLLLSSTKNSGQQKLIAYKSEQNLAVRF